MPPSSSSSAFSAPPSSAVHPTTATPAATCVPSPSDNVVQNGGFECGLAPWVATDITNTRHTVGGPGDDSPSAYEFDLVGTPSPGTGLNPANVNQDLAVAVGQAYTLTFRTYFDSCGDGFVGVQLDHAPAYTVDACDFGAGAFRSNTVNFTATVSPWNLRFDFEVGQVGAVVRVDNGTYSTLHASGRVPAEKARRVRDVWWDERLPGSRRAIS